MKKNLNKIVFTGVIVAFFNLMACVENDESYSEKEVTFYDDTSFNNKKSLIHEKIDKISDSLFRPSYMEIVNNHLLLLDGNSDRPLHIINIEKEEYIGSFINKGQGPSEIHVPWGISKINDNSFLAYDIAGKKIIGWRIDSLMKGNKPLFEKKINEKGICSSVQIVNDEIYYTSDLKSTNRIFKLDSSTGKEEGFGSLLNNYKNTSDINFSQACKALMSYNNDRFVIAYRLAPFFEIYNPKENSWKSIRTIDDFSPIYREVETDGFTQLATTKETRLGIIDISLTDKYIYLLYSGEKMHDYKMDVAKKVLVLDYEGNPITIFELDKNLSSFAVYNDSIIYGIHNDIKAELIKFNIN
jgi:hypothetical protein